MRGEGEGEGVSILNNNHNRFLSNYGLHQVVQVYLHTETQFKSEFQKKSNSNQALEAADDHLA